MIRITAFRWVPPFAQGLVRDLRVRWALEEAGFPYEVRLIGPEDQASPDYRRLQPFGQVPVFEDGDLALFESGAIVQHIAEQSTKLMPAAANERARVKVWLFAAMNSVEPQISNLAAIDLFYADQEWAKLRRPGTVDAVRDRLGKLCDWLEGRDYLENCFTVADLLMASVLRNLRHTDIVEQMPVLEAYRERCIARPAFQKALADQLATFAENDVAARTASGAT